MASDTVKIGKLDWFCLLAMPREALAEQFVLASATIQDLQRAVRLLLGRERGVPWQAVSDADVESVVAAGRELQHGE